MYNNISPSIFQDNLDRFCSSTFKKLLPNYTYKGINDTCPYLGPQIKTDAFKGLCGTWTTMYELLRILNPDIETSTITKYVIVGTKEQLLDKILKFNKFIINTLQNSK